MNWQTLYSSSRLLADKTNDKKNDFRNDFLKDYDRIVFSTLFRSLQNKTQVFPLPGAALVHNRLTHSLEVSCVGRSLGKEVGYSIAKKYSGDNNFSGFYEKELSSVIAAACLAHDIGNPPFGHSGEDAIRSFFLNADGLLKQKLNELSDAQQSDLLNFEGNANAFRALTHSFNEVEPGGFRLTLTTLASLIKYPCDSISGFDKSKLCTKKSGFFSSEVDGFKIIASTFHLPKIHPEKNQYARHPFVYLVEAADDICYRIMDFEDAYHLRIVSLEKIQQLFFAFFTDKNFHEIEKRFKGINDTHQKIQYLRAVVIGYLVEKTAEAFLNNEQALLDGSLNKPLIDLLSENTLSAIREIDEYSQKNIYNHRSVVKIEIAGFEIIGRLLNEFINAIINKKSSKSKKILQLIPEKFIIKGTENSFFNDVQSVVDFVSEMSDLYAVDLFKNISGQSFPKIDHA